MIGFLFYFLIALFPLGVITRLSFYNFINVSVQDVCIGIILLVSAPQIIAFIKKKNKFVIMFILFALINIIALLLHTKSVFEFLASLSYLVRLASYLLLTIPLLQIKKREIDIIKTELIVVGFLFVLFGYIQYFYYPTLRNLFYLGWDEHLYRLFSTLLDPNFAGIFILLSILWYSSFFFTFFKKSETPHRVLFIAGYIFLLPAFFLTYSRGSYISAIVSVIVFFFLIKQYKILISAVFIFILGIFLIPKDFGGEGVKLLRTASILARVDDYAKAWVIFTKNMLIGVGFDSLRFVSRNYGYISQKDFLASHSAAGVPNSYLTVLATSGIIGFILFFDFIINIFRKLIGHFRVQKDIVYTSGVFGSFVAVLVASLFENSLLYAPVMLWLVVITGVLFHESKKVKGGK